MGRIALNESQLRRIISEAARAVISESILEFLFDEPETIAAMTKDATREMGSPPMKSPDGRMYVWRLD